jgi:probable RNA-binding protein EIF1AD
MSGLGRRTHYRKHLTDSVLNDLPEPGPNERIAKVLSTRGSNQFDLIVAPKDPSADIEPTPQLAILPTKFRKLVWLKRNDYVICSCVDEEEDNNKTTADGIKHMIEHILYKEQIKHLKEKGFWPTHNVFKDGDEIKSSDHENTNANQTHQRNNTCESDEESEHSHSDDGIIYNDEQDDTYYCNMNRIAKLKVEDSSDEDSEED